LIEYIKLKSFTKMHVPNGMNLILFEF